MGACSVDEGPSAVEKSSTSITSPPTTSAPTTTVPPSTSSTTTTLWPTAADTADGLAVQIIEVENAVRSGALLADLLPLAMVQQRAYSALHSHPEWHAEVFEAAGPALAEIIQLHMDARGELQVLTPSTNTELPAWDIVEPAPINDLLTFYMEAETASGAPWEYLAAINLVETRMGRIIGLSSADAAGPMQFIPETWDRYGEGDIYDPRDSILAAGRLLANFGAPNDMANALWHYNPSDRYVNAVTSYARILELEPDSYRAFWGWQVYYATTEGAVLLPVGYSRTEPVDVVAYLEDLRN